MTDLCPVSGPFDPRRDRLDLPMLRASATGTGLAALSVPGSPHPGRGIGDEDTAPSVEVGAVTFWTESRVSRLIELVNEGRSRREIAKELGTTRNSVIGKCNRLALPDLRKYAPKSGVVRKVWLERLVRTSDELIREADRHIRAREWLSRSFDRRCEHVKDGTRCVYTRQPGRIWCAKHIYERTPRTRAGWTGLSGASGTSSIV